MIALPDISQIKARWQAGEWDSADDVLQAYPELGQNKASLLEVAYEEYVRASERGQKIDVARLCDRFRVCRTSLWRRIEVDRLLGQQPGLRRLPEDRPAKNERFLDYLLLDKLGEGAMGRVFLAEEVNVSGRHVVLKITAVQTCEADVLARLDEHPHIVPVYHVETDPETEWNAICMPYRGRTTLCQLLDAAYGENTAPPPRFATLLTSLQNDFADDEYRPMEGDTHGIRPAATFVEGIVTIGWQLAWALAHSHEHNVLHLDLKPTNVLLLPNGRTMLFDFNLSLDLLASEGIVGGTLVYSSPEQIEAMTSDTDSPRRLNARSDLFSLGVVLYELLTGEHPFVAWKPDDGYEWLSKDELIAKQRQGAKPLAELRPQLDRRVTMLVDRCLAFEGKDRPKSAREVMSILGEVLGDLHPVPRPWGLRSRVARVGVTLLAACAVLFGLLWFDSAMTPESTLAGLEPGSAEGGVPGTPDEHAGSGLADAASGLPARSDESEAASRFSAGLKHLDLGEYHRAFREFELAQQFAPSDRHTLAMAYTRARAGSHDEALHWYREVESKQTPPTVELLNAIGFSLLQTAQLQAALEYFDRAIEAAPNFSVAYQNRALVEMRRSQNDAHRDMQRATIDFEKALELGPRTPDLLYFAAVAHDLASEGEHRERTFVLLEEALERGLAPGKLANAPWTNELRSSERFRRMLTRPRAETRPEPTITLPVPFERLAS